MVVPNPPLGDELRERREERDWTQRDLAQHLNVSIQVVSAWENNRHDPIEEHATALVAYFGESDRYLSTEERRRQEQ